MNRDEQYRNVRIAVERMPDGRWRYECITEARRLVDGRYRWVRV